MCCPTRADVIKSNCELQDLRWNVNIGIGDVSHTHTNTKYGTEKMTPYTCGFFVCVCVCACELSRNQCHSFAI